MGNVAISGGAGGGAGSDECTAVLAHVLAGETAVTSDSEDEPGVGTMTVNSLLSFSCAAYSGKRILAKWQNPKAAPGKPYSGVYIRYNTSGYPGKTGGTQIYKGAGNNTTSEGQSQAYIDLPALGTTYYLSCYPYVTCSAGEMTGDVRNATVKTSAQISTTITGTRNYTIPAGYTRMDVFAVGGGMAGGYGNWGGGGAGGGGGYVTTVTGIGIASGQVINITIGAGSADKSAVAKQAGTTTVKRSGATLASAAGGGNGVRAAGGSGGGGGDHPGFRVGGAGGSNGSNGGGDGGGKGAGKSTKAWTGTLYAAGGGGGAEFRAAYPGGAGGGGAGGAYRGAGSNATAGTGSGGGGGAYLNDGGSGGNTDAGVGASGVVLIRLY